MRALRTLFFIGLTLVTLGLAFAAGYGTYWLADRSDAAGLPPALASSLPNSAQTQYPPAFEVFREAWSILEQEFYGNQPSQQERTYGAVRGMVESYNDPYTVFIEPQPRQREREDLSGEFGGIGAWVSQDDNGAIRLKPMVDRAAEKAGIKDGDILRAVNGQAIEPEMTTDDVVALIRGPVGESVELELFRESTAETLTLDVVRERIETPSVEWQIVESAPQVGLISIHMFSERTAKELDRAIEELRQQGVTHLILDLRHNPGGLLQAAIDVTSRFLHDGVVLFERKSDGSETTYRVNNAPRVADWPMAVLVDGATASASEIVAGALQDRGRALLVGEKTFGKGSVQFVHDLSDGSSIHVTVAHWMTPNGHEINGLGLQPDREVSATEGRDAPLEEAVRMLSAHRQSQSIDR